MGAQTAAAREAQDRPRACTPVAQAVRNLVENAIKHSPPGTIVDIRVTPTGAALVRDRGPGIPEAERAHVFKRFWRKDRNAEDGAGLGLAIAAKIVEAHGGQLSAASAPGGGAIFRFTLPVMEEETMA